VSNALFRQEALDAQKHKLMGSVTLCTPPYRWLMIAIVVMLSLAIVLFLLFGTYTKRERVVGQLLPTSGLLNISSPITGTIGEVHVRDGETLAAGTELMSVSTEIATELGSTRLIVDRQLKLQRERFELDLAGQTQLSAEAKQGLTLRAGALRDQLTQIKLQRDQRQRQSELAQRQLTKLQAMREKGYASNSQVEQQEGVALDAQARLLDLVRQRLDVEQQLTQVNQQLRELPLNTRNRLNDIVRKLAEIDQAITENEARRSIVLRAPQPSIVAAVLSKPGQIVGASQTIVSLLPQGTKLEAQLMIPSRAIGFIRNGERVLLRYQAYPYQKFGQQHGRVAEVSRTALSPQEVAQLTGQVSIQEQHYRVIVALDRQDIVAYGKHEPLRPGMSLEADVLIDTRRLIEWIFEPLHALGRRTAA
jgi:membrane fusion protein